MIDYNRLNELVKKFAGLNICVVGDFMLDEYIYGRVERISPEAPVPIVEERNIERIPGGAGNVLSNLIHLGANVHAAGILGKDRDGDQLKSLLLEKGMLESDLHLLDDGDRPTTRKTRIFAVNQQVCRLDREDKRIIDGRICNDLISIVDTLSEKLDAVIFSDYDKGVITPNLIQGIVEITSRKNIYTSVDPQVTHFDFYKGVDVLTPNHHEAGRFLGRRLEDESDIETAGREIIERLKAKSILITRGEKGMSLINGGCRHFATQAREVFDVTGAGDTVISIYTMAMAAGATAEEAVKLSNAGAGIVVGRVGAATISREELWHAAGESL